jgi:NAD(P)-dependent dehydrogenase (short-subunit alcohol dehydrogenase family)
VEVAVAAAVTAFGGVDTLVNNAGIEIAKPITELTSEEFGGILDINVTGTFRFTKAVIAPMAARADTDRDGRPVGLADRGHRPDSVRRTHRALAGRFGTPAEVTETVAFLASDDARFVNGAHYLIDGGLTANLF